MSRMSAKVSIVAAPMLALAACGAPPSRIAGGADEELDAALDRVTAQILAELPELATGLGLTEEEAGYRFNPRLSEYSTEAMQRRAEMARAALGSLAAIDGAALSSGNAVTRDVVMAALGDAAESAAFGYGTYGLGPPQPYVVTQMEGAYAVIPSFLDNQHPIASARDAEDYVARLAAYPRILDQETARIEADAAQGVVPPGFVIDGAVEQLEAFAAQAPEATVLVESLRTRTAEVADIDPGLRSDLVARATALVRDAVLPAYRRQIEALRALRPGASEIPGVWRLPNGEALYARALRGWTTTDYTPDEVHEMGLALIAALNAEMEAVLESQGMTQGSLAERLLALGRRPDQLYPNTDDGKARMIADLNAQIAMIEPLLPLYFGVQPTAPLEVRRVPPYIEAGSSGGYYESPSLDGSRPGVYYINLRDTSELPRYMLPTLTYHEGAPGHHLETSIARQSTDLPMIRSAILFFAAFSEGWGLYAEQLADEIGVYENDPWGRLGYLQSMAFRAARLVVDTGIHVKRWSREQAIDYMVETTGMERSAIVTEVDRYAVWPGQACAYMLGLQVITALREEARVRLGSSFDIRAFHDVILTNGGMPLSLLQRLVRDWIAATEQMTM